MKGSFEHILSCEDEEIEYELLDKQPTLHILKVRYSNIQYKHTNPISFFCRVCLTSPPFQLFNQAELHLFFLVVLILQLLDLLQ